MDCLAGALALAVCLGGAGAPARVAAATIDEVISAALADDPSIRLARSNRDVAASRVDEARAQHLPVLELGAAGRLAGERPGGLAPAARVNLYAGGSIDASIERDSLRERALASRVSVVRDDVAFAAAQAYLRLLRAHRLVDVQRRNLDRHGRLAADFEEIARIDRGRRFDLVQARARLEVVRGALEDRLAEVGTATQALARYYATPIDPRRMALPEATPIPPGEPSAATLDAHPAIVAARRELRSAEAGARVLELQKRPRLDLEAIGGNVPGSRVVLSWRPYDPVLGAAERAAVAAVLGAEAGLRDAELLVAENLRQALHDFESAARRHRLAVEQVRLGEELVEIYFEQFRVGRRNLLDLLTAYAELANAESTREGARVDTTLARYRFAYASARLAAAFERSSPTAATAAPARYARRR